MSKRWSFWISLAIFVGIAVALVGGCRWLANKMLERAWRDYDPLGPASATDVSAARDSLASATSETEIRDQLKDLRYSMSRATRYQQTSIDAGARAALLKAIRQLEAGWPGFSAELVPRTNATTQPTKSANTARHVERLLVEQYWELSWNKEFTGSEFLAVRPPDSRPTLSALWARAGRQGGLLPAAASQPSSAVVESFQIPGAKSNYAGTIVRFSDDGKRIVAVSDGKLAVWDRAGRKVVESITIPDGAPSDLALDAPGKLAVVSIMDSNTRAYDLVTGTVLWTSPASWRASLGWTAARDRLVVSSGTVVSWVDPTTGAPSRVTPVQTQTNFIAVSPDGAALLCASGMSGTPELRNSNDGSLIREFESDFGYITCVSFVANKSLAVCATQQALSVWDTTSGKLIDRYPIAAVPNFPCMAVSRDGRYAAFGGQRIHIFDLKTGLEVSRLNCYPTSIAISPDGGFIASGDDRGLVQVWPMPPDLPVD